MEDNFSSFDFRLVAGAHEPGMDLLLSTKLLPFLSLMLALPKKVVPLLVQSVVRLLEVYKGGCNSETVCNGYSCLWLKNISIAYKK